MEDRSRARVAAAAVEQSYPALVTALVGDLPSLLHGHPHASSNSLGMRGLQGSPRIDSGTVGAAAVSVSQLARSRFWAGAWSGTCFGRR